MGLNDRIAHAGSNGGDPAGDTIVVEPPATTPTPAAPPAPSTAAPEIGPPARGADPYADLKSRVHGACIAKLGTELLVTDADDDLTDRVLEVVASELALDRTPLSREEREQIQREIADDILGYGPLEPFLRDDSISEVMVNGAASIYVEREGKIERTPSTFLDDKHVLRIIDRIVSLVGRRIDESSPLVDARLPDGSRVNAIIPPLSLNGPSLTIRKFSRDPFTIDDLVTMGTLSPRAGVLLTAAVQREAERAHLRRYRHRQDDAAERPVGLRARRRADRDDRGRRRAPAAAGARRAARVAPGEHRGQRRDHASATSSATPCACGPTGSSSARSAARRPWTCSRR